MFPWSNYENYSDYIKQLMNMKPDTIDDFVKRIMAEHISYAPGYPHSNHSREKTTSSRPKKDKFPERKMNKTSFETKVFESHEDVFVQFQISNKEVLKGGKIYYNSNQLILKDIPHIGDKHKVLLPAIVQQRGARIHYKNGSLQIRLPKADDIQFTEIDLNF